MGQIWHFGREHATTSKTLAAVIQGEGREEQSMLIGYARTSTFEQEAGLQAQEHDLQEVGVERIFREQTSATGPREALAEAIDFARENDVLVVTKLDRLARSVADLVTLTQTLKRKKVGLRVLAMNLDTTTSTGRLMLNLLAWIVHEAGRHAWKLTATWPRSSLLSFPQSIWRMSAKRRNS
jgi:hypothetical protein